MSSHRPASASVEDFGSDQEPTKTILLVEDELTLADLVMETLEDLGYEVVHAPDAKAALAELRTRKFDLLFTDVIMPGSMNGVDLAILTRRNHPDLPILLVTGNAPETSLMPLEQFNVLTKPYRLFQLQDKLRELGLKS